MKSYVTMEQHVCVVCGKAFDTNAILLDKRLTNRFEMHTITGFSLCNDHLKAKNDGFIALVAVSGKPPGKSLTPVEANSRRTGSYALLKRDAWLKVFNVPAPEVMAYVDPEVLTMLEQMTKGGGECSESEKS